MGQSKKDDLAYKVLKDIKASPDLGLLRCVQCGMCASSCPAARHSEYDPRVVIKRVLDDDKTLLEDKYIWNCFYCYNCHSVCPVGNSVCEVNQILRQMAIDKDTGKKEKQLTTKQICNSMNTEANGRSYSKEKIQYGK